MTFTTKFFHLVSAFAVLLSARESLAKEAGKEFAVTLPIVAFGREAAIRLEKNLATQASLGLEVTRIFAGEEMSKEESEQLGGQSLMNDGYEAALYVTRYSNPARLSGFFWALGAGYRKMALAWHKKPDANYPLRDTYQLDESGRLNHQMTSDGMTGHIHGGYRYVGEEWPMHIGVYLGFRHFQGKYEDVQTENSGEADASLVTENPPTSEKERLGLRNRFMTRLEPSLNFGFVF